jgi:hypothetical protein
MAEDHAYGVIEKILVMREVDKPALGAVRCHPGLRAALHNEQIWIRGIAAAATGDRSLSQLPVLHTYLLDGENRLFPAGGLTPVARLSVLDWISLHEFIGLELPASALPGIVSQKLAISLVQAGLEIKAAALMTTLERWQQYGLNAPLARLERLRFAVSEKGEALIIGTPLPPLPGRTYTLQDDIFLPAGYAFNPPGIHRIIHSAQNHNGDGHLLFEVDGSCQWIPSSYCVPATRSAIRMTKGGVDV